MNTNDEYENDMEEQYTEGLSTSSTSSFSWLWIIVIIVAVVTVLIGLYLFYRQNQLRKQLAGDMSSSGLNYPLAM